MKHRPRDQINDSLTTGIAGQKFDTLLRGIRKTEDEKLIQKQNKHHGLNMIYYEQQKNKLMQ